MRSSELLKQLYKPKSNKFELLGQLKFDGSFAAFEKSFNHVAKHPITTKIIESNPLPKSYAELRKSRMVGPTDNLVGELAWNLITIKKYSKEIQEFLSLKNEYENNFLLQNLEKCEVLLTEIEGLSKSVWTLENRLLLTEYKNGKEANWTTLSELSKSVKDPFLLLFLENFSKKAERDLSFFRYGNIVSSQLDTIGLHAGLYSYFCFRLNYQAYTGFDNFTTLIAMESISSVFDRYLNIVDCLTEIIILGKNEFFNTTHEFLNRVSDLISYDTRLCQIAHFVGYETGIEIYISESIISVFDEYVKGNYEFCILHIPKIIKKHPGIVELYSIYVKSLIEAKNDYSSISEFRIPNEIGLHLYNVYIRNNETESSLGELYKLCSSFSSSNWAKQLLGLLQNKATTNWTKGLSSNAHFIINSQILNPIIFQFVPPKLRGSLFEKLIKKFPESISIQLNNQIAEGAAELIGENNDISVLRKSIYVNRAYLNSGSFLDVIVNTSCLLERSEISPHCREEIIQQLFVSHLELGQLNDALSIYISNYLLNQNYVSRLNSGALLDKIKSSNQDSLPSIGLPIFFKLTNEDAYTIYVALDDYLNKMEVEKPSDIFELIEHDNTEALYLLFRVCTMEVLHYSLNFNSSDEVENERLEILRKLLAYDIENEEKYIKEITEITQNSNIKKAIREVNKGRITVNVQQLKNIEASNIKEGFNRYKELAAFSQLNDISGIDISSRKFKEYFSNWSSESIKSKVVFLSDPAYITFKMMFVEIRDKFIRSKEYGLDGYLSTRIRHGTLENHLRSVFEMGNLVSTKSAGGEYSDNEYWSDKIPMGLQNDKGRLQNILKQFSKKIDDKIQYIKQELIQVKTEKDTAKKNGLFDYSLSESQLGKLFTVTRDNITDYNVFLDFVFDYLERTTDVMLQNIRSAFTNTIRNDFEAIISEFQSQIDEIIGNHNFGELNSSIVKCSTNIQNELENISEWFKLSNPSSFSLDIETLIQTSVQITNTMYPNYKLIPEVKVDSNLEIVGAIHLIYINRILLDNVIKHSKVDANNLELNISSQIVDSKFLRLIFKNNLGEKVNRQDLLTTLSTIKNQWNDNTIFERINVEGKSGYDKIRRILAYDLKCQEHNFDFNLNDNSLEIMVDIQVQLENL